MNKKFLLNKWLVCAFACAGIFTAVGCVDNIAPSHSKQEGGVKVAFEVSNAQEEMLLAKQSAALTRAGIVSQPYNEELKLQDFVTRVHKAEPHEGADVYLIESTVEGINPVEIEAHTRGKVEKVFTHSFSTLGYCGAKADEISKTPNFFYNKETLPTGALQTPVFWSWSQRYARFYGVSPQVLASDANLVLSPETHDNTPYVDFKVNSDVEKQVDLMTAYSEDVVYQQREKAPTTPSLKFYHALTAVSFSVGSNLSYPDKIKKIEIKDVLSEGRYYFQTSANGKGAKWDALGNRRTFTLDNINVETKKMAGQPLIGHDNDKYTFLMIPQTLNNVEVVITLETGKPIKVKLNGEWKKGTSKNYKLSNTDSGWQYTILADSPSAPATPTDQATGNFGVMSYRTDRTGAKQAVPWKVVGYSTDGGVTFTDTKPSWLGDLSSTSGEGGDYRQTGNAPITSAEVTDLNGLNQHMRSTQARGTSAAPYDLSTHNVKGAPTKQNTANCYVISAQGHYKLPLVYGNAIKEGADNTKSYNPQNTATKALRTFIDHAGQNIASPYITIANGGRYTATSARVVWADTPGLIVNPTVNNGYLQFQVPNTLRNGNAVVAVIGDGGKILWSWHLWFAPDFVLDVSTVKNHAGIAYTFPYENLGFKYTAYSGSPFVQRAVVVKVEQTVKNNNQKAFATFTLAQYGKIATTRTGYSMLYQFGRKDPFPGTDNAMSVGFIKRQLSFPLQTDITIPNAILNPNLFYANLPITDWNLNFSYINQWSADNTGKTLNNDAVVKTVYDPSPVGFVVPSSSAYTGFTTTGGAVTSQAAFNVTGSWAEGWTFNVNSGQPLYFSAAGWLGSNNGRYYKIITDPTGYYWVAVPSAHSADETAYSLRLTESAINPVAHVYQKANAFAVRPMQER